jgi:outer membrane lipoprotein LolB
MKILKFCIFIFFAFSLISCATLREQPESLNQSLSWQERATALAKIKSWNINAVMAIHTHADSESGTAHLQWQQHQQNYSLLLYGPLGMDAIKIEGHPGKVFLATADGKKFNAQTPELLLAQQTGWQLPVSNLYYWVRGLPAKNTPARMQFDAYHHLVHLNQQGWTIDFLRYNAVNQVDVPTKIILENWRMKIKIVISQWQFKSSD